MTKHTHEENEQLKKQRELEEKVNELENNWKRALADYINLQRRIDEEKCNIRVMANELLLRKLLPITDNMETLSNHIKDDGLNLILNEFTKVLKEEGIKEVETQDKEFDSNTMEAVETAEGEKNKVISTKQKGYFLNGKLIRPARVIVGQGNKEE